MEMAAKMVTLTVDSVYSRLEYPRGQYTRYLLFVDCHDVSSIEIRFFAWKGLMCFKKSFYHLILNLAWLCQVRFLLI